MDGRAAEGLRLAFDAGGTFTDVVFRGPHGTIVASKLPSIQERVADDVREVARTGMAGGRVATLLHATTLASNAVIQREVARTALLTTPGFRDVLDIKGQKRPNVYNPDWERLPPLIPRALAGVARGRMRADGTPITELSEDDVRELVARWLTAGVESVAVCFLNSYANPAHERQAAAVIEAAAPGLAVCCSHDIDADINEYERASTTAVNASLVPVIERYLDRLEAGVAGLQARLMVMRSNGGLMDSRTARALPVHMIESGSAAGALAAARLARERGLHRVLALDMGGTTAKACLVEDGTCLERPWGEIGEGVTVATRLFGGGGYAIRVPALDIVEIGAGGGSIGWIDEGGALRAGPRSAGADPGPACYSRGGTEPTVTDACVVLGYTNPVALARGTLPIDPALAAAAITRRLADPLSTNLVEAAAGLFAVANATMTRALRAVSTERGYDARSCDLIAFGGAGPVHATALADSLGVGRVHVPMLAGVFSALGLLLAEVRHDVVIGVGGRLDDLDPKRVEVALAGAERRARDALRESRGGDPPGSTVECFAAVRYAYQIGELVVPLERDGGDDLLAGLGRRFAEAHRREFGFTRDDAPIEVQNIRLTITSQGTGADFRSVVDAIPAPTTAKAVSRRAWFGSPARPFETPVVSRLQLAAGRPQPGPLLVDEDDTTIVVPPGWTAACDAGDRIVVLERAG